MLGNFLTGQGQRQERRRSITPEGVATDAGLSKANANPLLRAPNDLTRAKQIIWLNDQLAVGGNYGWILDFETSASCRHVANKALNPPGRPK